MPHSCKCRCKILALSLSIPLCSILLLVSNRYWAQDMNIDNELSVEMQSEFESLEKYGMELSVLDSNPSYFYRQNPLYKKIISKGKSILPILIKRLPSDAEIALMDNKTAFCKVQWILDMFTDLTEVDVRLVFQGKSPTDTSVKVWRDWFARQKF